MQKTDKEDKLDKNKVKGLPPHAQVQKMSGFYRVYFQYAYHVNKEKRTERDYLGKVDEATMEFVPNAYFLLEKPVFENRPIYRIKNEERRLFEIKRRNQELLARKSSILKNAAAKAVEEKSNESNAAPVAEDPEAKAYKAEAGKVEEKKIEPTGTGQAVGRQKEIATTAEKNKTEQNPVAVEDKTDSEEPVVEEEAGDLEAPEDVLQPDESKQVGASAVALMVLMQTGMLKDLYSVLENVKDVINLVNLAIHAATTDKPTYHAEPISSTKLFIGGKCLSSPRASEFYQRIGADQSINKKISRERLKRVGRNGLIALDGTKIPCNSKNIAIAAIGKDKNGGFSNQISFSMLAHIPTGQAVGYEYYAGNIPDISSIDCYMNQWQTVGIQDQDVTFVMDRGFFSKEAITKFCGANIKFLVGMRTNVKVVSNLIENRNYEFYEPTSLLNNADCYGVKTPWNLNLKGQTANVDVFVYRSPLKEMENSRDLKEKLVQFKKSWDEGNYDFNSKLLALCKNPTEGKKLTIDWSAYNQECYLHGFFAMASNIAGLTLEGALDEYSSRNEVEVMLKIMFMHLLKTTRVHSLAALSGLLLAVFAALNILGVLRHRMNKVLPESWLEKDNCATIKSRLGLSEMLWKFDSIRLERTSRGKLRLVGNTLKLKELANALGMEGLFDSPENLAKLFSPSYLEQIIGAK